LALRGYLEHTDSLFQLVADLRLNLGAGRFAPDVDTVGARWCPVAACTDWHR
jgi:hypothetical protein